MNTPRGIPVKYVDLLGAVNLGGMHTRNLDAERDLCALHLHQETGGVFVTRGDDEFFIGPHAIGSVQLQKGDLRGEEERDSERAPQHITHKTKVPAAMLTPLAEDVSKGAHNLADEVLAELSEEASEAGVETTRPSTRARKSRRN